MRRLLVSWFVFGAILCASALQAGEDECQPPQDGCGMCRQWWGYPTCACVMDCFGPCVGNDELSICFCFWVSCAEQTGEWSGNSECFANYLACLDGIQPPPPPWEEACPQCKNILNSIQCMSCASCMLANDFISYDEYRNFLSACSSMVW